MEVKDQPQSDANTSQSENSGAMPVENERELTYGERAVGLRFNPSENPDVKSIKQKCADVIDELNDLRNKAEDGEVKRMLSIAITEIQTGQMWGVKAVTWK